MKHHLIPAALASLLLLCSCATDTGDASVDRRGRVTNAIGKELFNVVLNFGLTQGRDLLTGQNGQDAAAGAFEAAKGLVTSDSISRVMTAYAGPQIAAVAQAQFDKAAPVTPKERSFTANVIGAALQLAANQLTK